MPGIICEFLIPAFYPCCFRCKRHDEWCFHKYLIKLFILLNYLFFAYFLLSIAWRYLRCYILQLLCCEEVSCCSQESSCEDSTESSSECSVIPCHPKKQCCTQVSTKSCQTKTCCKSKFNNSSSKPRPICDPIQYVKDKLCSSICCNPSSYRHSHEGKCSTPKPKSQQDPREISKVFFKPCSSEYLCKPLYRNTSPDPDEKCSILKTKNRPDHTPPARKLRCIHKTKKCCPSISRIRFMQCPCRYNCCKKKHKQPTPALPGKPLSRKTRPPCYTSVEKIMISSKPRAATPPSPAPATPPGRERKRQVRRMICIPAPPRKRRCCEGINRSSSNC